jgi:hypothetical protein
MGSLQTHGADVGPRFGIRAAIRVEFGVISRQKGEGDAGGKQERYLWYRDERSCL